MTISQTTTDDAQQRLVPQRRFPEFRDAPGWEEVTLGSVLTEHGEKNDGSSEVHSVSVHKGVINQIEHLGRSFAAKDRSKYNLAKPHDIIYTKSPTGDFPLGIVKQNRLPYNVIVSPLYGVFSPTNRHLGYILDTYFESRYRATSYLAPITQKGAKNTIQISNDAFLSKGIYLPGVEAEQEKIANCLGSLDNLITVEGRKLVALRDHKKGLMQQLFPREGETQPRLRFPEFRDSGNWQGKELGPMTSKVGSGITPKGGSKNYKESGRPFVRSQNVGWGQLLLDDVAHIDEETHASFGGTEIEHDDVLLNISGASIGRSAVADQRIVGGNVNQHVCIIRADRDSIRPIMLSQYLVSELGQAQIDQCQAGGNRQGLNFGQIRSFTIPVPPLEAEQDRIADCLSTLDTLIAVQGEKLDALRSHKRGLMQQLFPCSEDHQ